MSDETVRVRCAKCRRILTGGSLVEISSKTRKVEALAGIGLAEFPQRLWSRSRITIDGKQLRLLPVARPHVVVLEAGEDRYKVACRCGAHHVLNLQRILDVAGQRLAAGDVDRRGRVDVLTSDTARRVVEASM